MIQCRTVYVMEMNGKRVERDELSIEVNKKGVNKKTESGAIGDLWESMGDMWRNVGRGKGE